MPDEAVKSPYVGLQPFREEHQRFFFGRERDIRVIASNLLVPSLTLLYGPSGVGKSSILRAGVMPFLATQANTAVVYFNRWQDVSFADQLRQEIRKAVPRPAKNQLSGDGEPTLDALARPAEGVLYIMFDQFEEYLLYHDGTRLADDFDGTIARLVNDDSKRLKVLIGIREDGLSKFDRRFGIRVPDLLGNTLPVAPLTTSAARSAIREPLRVWNETRVKVGQEYEIEDDLVEAVLAGVQSGRASITENSGLGKARSGAEEHVEAAFLQLVLTKLWEAEVKVGSRKLRLETLKALGGASKILQSHVDDVMAQLDKPSHREIASRIFQYLVTPSGAKIAQAPADLVEWAQSKEREVRTVLNALTDPWETRILRRLATPERYELYHDVLGSAVLEWCRHYNEAEAREREKKLRDEEDRRKQKELEQAQALAKEQQEKLELQKRLDEALKGKNRDIIDFGTFLPEEDEAKNLENIRMTVEEAAQASVRWHLESRRRARQTASVLKFGAAIFLMFGFVQPAIGSLSPQFKDPLIFYLFIGGAFACFGIDRYMGYSDKQARYTSILNELQGGLADFQMEWATTPKNEYGRQALLQRARGFRKFIEDAVRGETNLRSESLKRMVEDLSAKSTRS